LERTLIHAGGVVATRGIGWIMQPGNDAAMRLEPTQHTPQG
jgi:hypothetical protein